MHRHAVRLSIVVLAAAACAVAQDAKKTDVESPGPLLLIGGRHQDLTDTLRKRFFDLAGGKNARIVVIPTAVADVGNAMPDQFLKPWQELGPQSVQILHTRDRKTADDPAFVGPLTVATAVFFTNGHLHRVLDVYRGTLVERELKRLQARGGLIGGTGSGAAALCELVGNRADDTPPAQAGLGALSGFLFDGAGRLEEAVAANPAQVGLAIEPGAAVEIRGQDLRVIGDGTVTVRLAKGAGLEAKVDVLKPGVMLNVNELRRAAASRVEKPPQRGKEQPQVVRDHVKGSINHGDGKSEWQRITGKARVLDAHTLEFADGTRIDLDIAVPELNQMGSMGDTLYPAGKEAAAFLGKLVADRPVMCFQYVRGEGPWHGYVGDTNLERAMIVGGWALADHSSLHADETLARESQRGLWRGKFVHPDDWRAGVRLPGEPPPPKLADERQVQSLVQSYASCEAACALLVARIVKEFPSVRRLNFPLGCELTDEGLKQLAGLSALEELDLSSCGRITDVGLAHLKSLTQLKRLGLPYGVTDTNLEHVAHLTELQELSLTWAAKVTDDGLARLKGLERLRRLTLHRVNITDAGMGHLRGLKSLEVLSIYVTTPITDAGITHLKELDHLQYVDIGNADVTDAGALQLAGLKRLRVLILPERVSDTAKGRLREALPNLRFDGRPEDALRP